MSEKNPFKKAFRSIANPILSILPDSLFYRINYLFAMRAILHLKKTKTFGEKIQWLKLYDRTPMHTQLADKYAVRSYVKEKIGEEYLIPLLGVWERAEDIDFDKLPEQFVLKCSHDSGSVVICKDKSKLDIKKTVEHFRKKLNYDHYKYTAREWAYKDISRKIIAEKYMTDESGADFADYKIHCFNGEPKYIQLISGRFSKIREAFYDTDWNFCQFTVSYPSIGEKDAKPAQLEKMLKFAKELSNGFLYCRVDLYIAKGGQIYFGEFTWYPEGGYLKFNPKKYEIIFGDLIKLEKTCKQA